MAYKSENQGMTDWGTKAADNLVVSIRPPRTMPIVLAPNQGVLKAGTLLMSNGSGKYVICDDETKLAGVILEEYNTGTGGATDDVRATMSVDIDLRGTMVFSGVTSLATGYYPTANILIKGE